MAGAKAPGQEMLGRLGACGPDRRARRQVIEPRPEGTAHARGQLQPRLDLLDVCPRPSTAPFYPYPPRTTSDPRRRGTLLPMPHKPHLSIPRAPGVTADGTQLELRLARCVSFERSPADAV